MYSTDIFENFDNMVNFSTYYSGPLAYTSVILISACVEQHKYLAVLKKLYNVDKKFELLKRKPNLLGIQLALRCYHVTLLTGYIVYFVTLYLCDILITQLKERICSHICIIIITLIMSAYIGVLLMLNCRIRELNRIIDDLNREDVEIVTFSLTVVADIHHMLSEISELSTSACSFPLLLLNVLVYLATTVMLLSYSGIVPQLRGEMTFWVALYWGLYVSTIALCEMVYEGEWRNGSG